MHDTGFEKGSEAGKGLKELRFEKIIWDYSGPLKDELWQARRIAEFFPFVADELTEEDKGLLLRHLDEIKLPNERKEFIRMVCGGE